MRESRLKAFVRRHPTSTVVLSSVAVAGVLAWVVFVLGRPLPPRTVVMTTGPEGGAFRIVGEAYRRILARERINLKLVPSLGNVENLQRLKNPASGISVGFVAGGLTSAEDSPDLVSLGTISYDPVWIFCRGIPDPEGLESIRGKRVSIGPEGGGTRAVMLELLRANDMTDAITPFALTPGGGGEALLKGEIDCACMVSATGGPIIKKLLAEESVQLVNFPRADAYVALYPHLRKLTIFRGVGSLAKDLPPKDVTVMAMTTSLVVREDLHPAIQFLLLEAASEIHSKASIVRQTGRFPSAEPWDLPLSKVAQNYYRSGGTFLQRNLPFWLAVIAQRVLLVILPLLGILYPLMRIIEFAFGYFTEKRFRVLYTELRRIDAEKTHGGEEAEQALSALEARLAATKVSPGGARALYFLKQHIALVRERLRRRGPQA